MAELEFQEPSGLIIINDLSVPPSTVRIFNTRDFGATGDGTTDDTAAIAAAAAAIPATGGVLFFPAPEAYYKITAGVSFEDRANITISGAQGAEIKYAAGTVDTVYNSWPNYGLQSIFRFIRCDDITVEGVTLNGNISGRTASTPNESFNSNLTFAACNRVVVRQCHITEGMTDGIIVMYSSAGTLSTKVTITDCTITKCRRNNVSLVGQDGAIVSDCLLDLAGTIQGVTPKYGLDIEPDGVSGRSKNVFVTHNTISNSAGTYGMALGGTGSVGVVIDGNVFLNNVSGGLDIENTNTNVIVVNNQISGSTAGSGLRFLGSGLDLIQGNSISGNKYGMNSYEVNRVTISNNKIFNNTYQGIVLTTFKDVHLEGNLFYDNTSVAGDADGAGYAVYATRTDANSIIGFHNNTMLNTAGATTKMSGARVDAACVGRASGNIANNLKDVNAMIRYMSGHGNWSADGADRLRSISAETNFDDTTYTFGGRLLIGGKVHYYGTAAPTSGTWQKGDFCYNTAPGIGKPLGWVCVSNGTPGTWVVFEPLPNMSADKGDAIATLTVGTDSLTQQWKTALTASRAVTLSTTGAYDGATFRIVRTGGDTGGPWALTNATFGSIYVNQFADVQYDGSAWKLVSKGTLTGADAWISAAPTWGCLAGTPTIGNGTLVGHYRREGKTVMFSILLTVGSTTTFGTAGNAWTFTIPGGGTASGPSMMAAWMFDGATNYPLIAKIDAAATTIRMWRADTGAELLNNAPATLTSGDYVSLNGTLEIT